MELQYYLYILSNENHTVLYVGVTNNLKRRVYEHRSKLIDGFTKKYNIGKLVYYEAYNDIKEAIEREKKIKKWNRAWKDELIVGFNPDMKDLYNE